MSDMKQFLFNPDNGITFAWSRALECSRRDLVRLSEDELRSVVKKRISVEEIVARRREQENCAASAEVDERMSQIAQTAEAAVESESDAAPVSDGGAKTAIRDFAGMSASMDADGRVAATMNIGGNNAAHLMRENRDISTTKDEFGNGGVSFAGIRKSKVTREFLEKVRDDDLYRLMTEVFHSRIEPLDADASDEARAEYFSWIRRYAEARVDKYQKKAAARIAAFGK